MIAGPGCPGVGECVNHAARSWFGPGCGTDKVPSCARPSGRTLERTPIAGMVMVSGGDAGSGALAAWPAGCRPPGVLGSEPWAVAGRELGGSIRPMERGGCGARTCAATATRTRTVPAAPHARARSVRPPRRPVAALRRDILAHSVLGGRAPAGRDQHGTPREGAATGQQQSEVLDTGGPPRGPGNSAAGPPAGEAPEGR